MNADQPPNNPPNALRARAVQRVSGEVPDPAELSSDDIRKLVYELRVHQEELRMQNRELVETQFQVADALDRWRDLYEFAPIGYVTLAADRTISAVNLVATRLLATEREILLGTRLERWFAPDARDTCYQHLSAATTDPDPHTIELPIPRPAGPPAWVCLQTTWRPAPDGRDGEWRITLHDITELQHAQSQLRESEQRYRALADNLPGGAAFILDRDLRYLLAEGEALQHADCSSATFLGRTIWEALDEDLARRYEPYFRRALAGESYRIEHESHGRHFITRGIPLRDEDGAVSHVLAMSYDITDRVRAEQALHELNASLEQRVVDRTRTLQLLSDIARTANDARSVDEAFSYALRRISEHNGWVFGHAFLVEPDEDDDDRPVLVPVQTAYEQAPDVMKAFRAATLRLRLRPREGLPGRAYDAGRVQWTTDIGAELHDRRAEVGAALGLRAAIAFPVTAGDEVGAVLEFFTDHEITATPSMLETMTGIGTILGRVVERQRFERQLARALLAEQQRVGGDLHDTVGQQLAALALLTDRLAGEMENGGRPPDAAALRELSEGVRGAVDATRAVVRDLLPPVVAHADDFAAALRQLAERVTDRSGIACTVELPDELAVEQPDVAVHLFRVISEAVANAVRHADARMIAIHAESAEESLSITVRDDGVGIPSEEIPLGSGLQIMRHRANVIGANLRIKRGATGGTTVHCVVPCHRIIRPEADELLA